MTMTVVDERSLIAEACPVCSKPVYADEGYYSIDGSHWDCHTKGRAQLDAAIKKGDAALARLGFKSRKKRGEGEATLCVKGMIVQALRDFFGSDDEFDVVLYLNPLVWNQYRFDVQRFQGSAKVNGRLKCAFGSWAGVSHLAKYKRLNLVCHGAHDYEVLPDLSSRRSKKQSKS